MIDLATARALAIAAQGLDRRPSQPVTKADVLATIGRLGVVQIDTISVVARAHYFVLWSRLGEYQPGWFDELQYPDGRLFEYWAHAASFIPIELWPWFRPAMISYASEQRSSTAAWINEHKEVLELVRADIRQRGPLRSVDFGTPDDHLTGGWWNRKPTKTALDLLWTMGELMIQRRINFQRVYELTERVLPGWDALTPTAAECNEQLTELALKAMGIATLRHLPDYYRLRRAETTVALRTLVDKGRATLVQVEGWDTPAYVHVDHQGWLDHGPPPPTLTTLLSPFDSLIWDRERTQDFWQFSYKIECYTPEAQRRYGYFTLPILWRDRLVGRVDAKAERKAGIFRVKALHLEPGVELSDQLLADLAWTLQDCASWHRTPEVIIELSDPPALKAALAALIGGQVQ